MDVTQPTNDEQSKHWNATAGCAWVDAQDLLDQMMKGLEDLLVDGVARAAPHSPSRAGSAPRASASAPTCPSR
jgi:hypothetical protein